MSEPANRASHEAKVLDIERLRGIAIASVMFLHFSFSFHLFNWFGLPESRRPFWLGVELFFVISGYVVSRSFAKTHQPLQFYIRRVFRLWPVLASLVAFVAAINFLPGITEPWGKLLRQVPPAFFGYYSCFTGEQTYHFAIMWSLAVEEQFYFVFPWLVLGLTYGLRCRPGTIGLVFVGLYLLLAVALRIGLAWGNSFSSPWIMSMPWIVQYIVWARFDFIAVGVILFYRPSIGRPLAAIPRWAQHALMLGCLTVPFVVMFVLGKVFDLHKMSPRDALGLLWCSLCFGVVVCLAGLDRDLLRLPRLLDQALLYLGSRSYSLYLFHFSVMMAMFSHPVVARIERLLPGLSQHPLCYHALVTVLCLLATIAVVEAVYRLIEKPGIAVGRAVIRRLFASRQPVEVPAPALKRAAA